MRTDLPINSEVSLSEWQAIVKDHYSEAKQNARIEELLKYVMTYVKDSILSKNNPRATFDGVVAYLDVDTVNIAVFEEKLKKKCKDLGLVADTDNDKHDIVITRKVVK